jgi:signal transduction histidine kinase
MRIAPTDLGEVLARVLELLDDRLAAQGIRVDRRIDPEVEPIAADADRLQQVFLNLALNAADAMPGGGRLSIHLSVDRRAPPGNSGSRSCVSVSFSDTGCGIAPENLPRLFEPFFTTKEVGGGTGMGLAISYGIVQEHGGWMDVASTPGRGTRMTIFLPLQARHATAPEPEAAA